MFERDRVSVWERLLKLTHRVDPHKTCILWLWGGLTMNDRQVQLHVSEDGGASQSSTIASDDKFDNQLSELHIHSKGPVLTQRSHIFTQQTCSFDQKALSSLTRAPYSLIRAPSSLQKQSSLHVQSSTTAQKSPGRRDCCVASN